MATSTTQVLVAHPLGIQPIIAIAMARTANIYPCDVSLTFGKKRANAKSVLDIIALEAPHGARLYVAAHGERTADAVAALAAVIRQANENA